MTRQELVISYLAVSNEAFGSAHLYSVTYRGADNSLARPGRRQATATEDFDFHISYL